MYIPLPTPKEMGLWDKITIEHVGILGEILMENASWQVVYAIQDDFPNLKHKKVAIIAGPGNNGGDGFAVARHLSNLGADVKIFYKKDLESYKKDAAYHVNLTLKMGISTEKIPENDFNLCGYDIIIDALLGTGFSGELRDDYKRVVEAINRAKPSSYILSVDIPSGLNGYMGIPSPIAVKANVTVTFEEAKVGLYLPEAKEFV
ncbi:NAD(P)H-hydrate epimerase, partial [Desulfothermus sp.]